MTIFFGLVFFGLVAWFVTQVFRAETSLRNVFWPALVIKCLAGFGVGMVYIFYYKVGDTLVFFSDAVGLSDFAKSNMSSYLNFLFTSEFSGSTSVELSFGDRRAIFMDKIVSMFSLVSFDNYWLVTFYLTLLSFFAAWYLVKQIHSAFPQVTGPAIVAFLFFPSITFWTSGIIKETIAMAGLYFVCGTFIRIWSRKSLSPFGIATAMLSVYLLWNLKYYFAGIFLAVILTTLVYQFISLRFRTTVRGRLGHFTWFAIFSVLIVGVTFLHPNFKSHRLLDVMVQNYQEFHRFSEPGHAIFFSDLEPTIESMIVNSPKALFGGLFRPLFFDANNIFAWMISIENIFLLVTSLFALRYVRELFSPDVGVLLCAIVVYVILLAIFITLSTPNLGTLARYRVGYLPFFVFLILLAPPIAIRLQNILNIQSKSN
jgi:hypothetical protein